MAQESDNYFDYTSDGNGGIVNNPVPILQQQKSNITTNTFLEPGNKTYDIPSNQQLNNFGTPSSSDVLPNLNETKTPPKLHSPSFTEINKKLSITIIDTLDDLLNKPDNINWKDYALIVFAKDDRYTYFSILLIIFALILILFYL
jgi:hypothetical protein